MDCEHYFSFWSTSECTSFWMYFNVVYIVNNSFPVKRSGCMLSPLKRPGPIDKLSYKANNCFSKASVCSTLQPASFSGTKLTFFQSALKHLLGGSITVHLLWLIFLYDFSYFKTHSFKFLLCLLPNCSSVPADSASFLKEINLPGCNAKNNLQTLISAMASLFFCLTKHICVYQHHYCSIGCTWGERLPSLRGRKLASEAWEFTGGTCFILLHSFAMFCGGMGLSSRYSAQVFV